ncbi:MAG: glycosyltransferase family 2 protein [Desulfoprunum sp.]
MKNHSPLVSVIVPSYNHEQFIEQCIDSILNQSYKNYELIVIDDGSSDNSRFILNDLQKKYGFTLVLQENMGLPRTLNKGIQEFARGTFITFCASDDYWLPGKLEKQVFFMEQYPDIPMCFGKAYVVDEDSNVMQKSTILKNRKLKGGYIFKDLLLINFHPPVNYLFRRKIFDELGYYKENIFTEDLYMNLCISNKYKIGYIDDYLICYREIQNDKIKPPTLKTSISHLECIKGYKESEIYPEAIRRWHFRNFTMYSAYRKHKLLAFKGMINSVRYFYESMYLKSIVKLILFWK